MVHTYPPRAALAGEWLYEAACATQATQLDADAEAVRAVQAIADQNTVSCVSYTLTNTVWKRLWDDESGSPSISIVDLTSTGDV